MTNLKTNSLVFLPGWGFKSSVLTELSREFSQNNNVVQLDLPVMPSNLDEMVELLHTQIPLQSTIVAWSLGGLLAMYLCDKFPDRCKKLILIASTPNFFSARDWPGIDVENAEKFYHEAQQSQSFLQLKFVALVQYPDLTKALKTDLCKHLLDFSDANNSLKILFSANVTDSYARLSMPVVCIMGEKDLLVPIAVTTCLKQINARTQINIIADAGHAPFLTHSYEVTQIIQEVLDAA